MDFRSRANAVVLLDLGHKLKGENVQEETQKLKVYNAPTAEELMH
jgi:hypothetical protein